jgi:hypothetical protein
MDVAAVGSAVLNAAKAAAGDTWSKIQHDFASDLGIVLRNAASIETKLATGELSEAEAEVLLRNQSAILFILTQEVELDAQLVVQDAVNAAIDAMWAAVKTGAAAALP